MQFWGKAILHDSLSHTHTNIQIRRGTRNPAITVALIPNTHFNYCPKAAARNWQSDWDPKPAGPKVLKTQMKMDFQNSLIQLPIFTATAATHR